MQIIDEKPFDRAIEAAETATAAFCGWTESGPEGVSPEPLENFAQFRALYGSGSGLLARSVHGYFAQGGRRLYIANSGDTAAALEVLEGVEGISLVAAPGIADAHSALISHAEKTRFRVALLDSVEGMGPGEVLSLRRAIDSRHAALYYPWVRTTGIEAGAWALTPPSGLVAGVCARVDRDRGVWKAPAGVSLELALGAERPIAHAENERLAREGINCLRVFAGRGVMVWGARTTSLDSEFRYLNVRRVVNFIEESVARGLEWTVFEAGGEPLWAQVRGLVESFLLQLWRNGALAGVRPEDAFFVHCGPNTMTQNDIDSGRLIVQIGIAPLRPAEFLIFRVATRTAEA